MKKSVSLMLVLCFVLMAFIGCTPTTSTTTPPAGTSDVGSTVAPPTDVEPISITILAGSTSEAVMGVLRDLLIKAGFEVELTLTPDASSSTAVRESGEWDIMYGGWSPISGPDNAIRSLVYTDAPFNRGGIADPEIDALVDQAASVTKEESWAIYEELENMLITENAYLLPLFSNVGYMVSNKTVLNPDTINMHKSRIVGPWEMYEYNDTSLNDTRPLVYTVTSSEVTSYWPPTHNSILAGYFTSNGYIRLVNIDEEDNITTDSALAYNYAMAENNEDFYFILRDDVTYAKVENNTAVDTGIKVSADDVLFSLGIAMDRNSVPLQSIYTLFEKIDTVTVVTDLADLEGTVAGGEKVVDVLSAGLPSDLTTLTDDIANVDNAGGTYQVVKVTTKGPFPQIVNYLAHQAAGIFNRASVEAVMADIDVASYDPATDVLYGERAALTQGPSYDNHVLFSGPYAVLYQDQYMGVMQRNPGFMPETDRLAKIKDVQIHFIKQTDTAVSSFRSGDIDFITSVPDQMIDILKADETYEFESGPTPLMYYMTLNMHPEFGRVVLDEDVRKALLYAIDQDAYLAYYNGNKFKAYSPLTPQFPEAPNTLVADPNKVSEHLAAYHAKK